MIANILGVFFCPVKFYECIISLTRILQRVVYETKFKYDAQKKFHHKKQPYHQSIKNPGLLCSKQNRGSIFSFQTYYDQKEKTYVIKRRPTSATMWVLFSKYLCQAIVLLDFWINPFHLSVLFIHPLKMLFEPSQTANRKSTSKRTLKEQAQKTMAIITQNK